MPQCLDQLPRYLVEFAVLPMRVNQKICIKGDQVP
jgi:hypothetical protein